jgi:hypothetical protein
MSLRLNPLLMSKTLRLRLNRYVMKTSVLNSAEPVHLWKERSLGRDGDAAPPPVLAIQFTTVSSIHVITQFVLMGKHAKLIIVVDATSFVHRVRLRQHKNG